MRDTGIAFEAVTDLPFDDAVARCRAELAVAGFGVLTEIDLEAKLREKLGVEVGRNLILGACHPPSAHRALQAAPEITVLLPCNVAIARENERTVIRAMNPTFSADASRSHNPMSTATPCSRNRSAPDACAGFGSCIAATTRTQGR